MHAGRRSRWIRALAVCLFVAVLAPALLRAALPEQVCDAAKIKAASNKAKAQLTCYAKAVLKGTSVDPECLTKAEDKYFTAFAKADAKGPCSSRSAAMIKTQDDFFVLGVLNAVQCGEPGSFCSSNDDCCSGSCPPIGFCSP